MFTVISKPNCPYCVKAKTLLTCYNLPYKEFVAGKDLTREEVLEDIPDEVKNKEGFVLTVPQIYHSVHYVGGYSELEDYLVENDLVRVYDVDIDF